MNSSRHATREKSDVDIFHLAIFRLDKQRSTPNLKNGEAGFSLNSGKLAVGVWANELLSNFLQTTHWLSTPFTTCLSFGTQKLERNSTSVLVTPLWKTLSWRCLICRKVKCHCLRKCSRGWKCGSADFDETCSRSWPYWDIPKPKLVLFSDF